jgi:hypothetical protein
MFDTATESRRMCARCSTELSPLALVCPACSALVHRGKLEDLARLAEAAAVEGDHAAARAHWLEARELVPARSEQHELIGARIADLTSRIEAAPPQPSNRAQGSWTGRSVGVTAAIGLLLVGKLKFLLLGLSKLSTVASIHHFAVSAIVANVVQREVAGDVKHPRPRAARRNTSWVSSCASTWPTIRDRYRKTCRRCVIKRWPASAMRSARASRQG